MDDRPWSNAALRRLSEQIRDATPANVNDPTYGEVMIWYNDLAAWVQQEIIDISWSPLLGNRPFQVTSRPKTIDTLRQKLIRDRSTPLTSVQDVAGVRFESEMSLDEQDAVANAICGRFGHDPLDCVRDMRQTDHSGYRAVHIWLRLPSRVEVQVRTHLQGQWANVYESAADLFGRGIRYDRLPTDNDERALIVGLRRLSIDRIASMEADRNEIALLALAFDDLTRTGNAEIPRGERSKLEALRARFERSEVQLRDEMQRLHGIFLTMRDQRG